MYRAFIRPRSIFLDSSIELSRSTGAVRLLSSRLKERPPPIKLSERAAARIKELIGDKDDVAGVRISVKRRGCNGYSYIMNYAKKDEMVKTKDELVAAHGVNVYVDPKAIFFIVGTEMDFKDDELSSEFTFTNPNSKGQCGCGESFNV
ncbi:iron-sulfur cluster assembly accessory protein [archaeon]|nr:MAG: iron-sulfur cluster assembly accessory protein [archaeon]